MTADKIIYARIQTDTHKKVSEKRKQVAIDAKRIGIRKVFSNSYIINSIVEQYFESQELIDLISSLDETTKTIVLKQLKQFIGKK